MKKLLIASAALAMVAGTAQAQSSVTVYGLIDAGYATSNVDYGAGLEVNQKAVGGLHSANGTGTLSGSRLGFRGTEDLGGGLKANFVLETGVNYSTGQSATTTAAATAGLQANAALLGNTRQAWAGLSSANAGEVRIGTHNSLAKDITEAIDPNGGVTLTGFISQLGLQATRPANSITYLSPVMNGFSFQAQYDEGETTTSATIPKDNYAQSFSVMYKAGALELAAVTETRKNAYYAANGSILVDVGAADYSAEDVVSPAGVTGTSAGATMIDKVTFNAFGGAYTISGVRVAAMATSLKFKDATAADNGEIKSKFLAGSGNVGPFTIRASVSTGEMVDNGTKTYDIDAYQVVAFYPLSKRTHVYGALGQTKYDSPTADRDVKINQMGVGMRTTF
jgi:predicted porin